MKITLCDDQRTLRLAFRYHAGTVAFAKSLVGSEYDKRSKGWLVPLCHLRTLLTQFPSATVDDRATVVEARYELWRTWLKNHNACGVYFALAHDATTVVAYRDDGLSVGDALQAHVAKRSPQLREWLHCQRFPTVRPAPRPSVWDTAEPTVGDRLIHAGTRNAARAAERRERIVERARRAKGKRRKAKMKQAELLTEE